MNIVNKFNQRFQPQVDKLLGFPEWLWGKTGLENGFTKLGTGFMNYYLNLKPLSDIEYTDVKDRDGELVAVTKTISINLVFGIVAASFFVLAILINSWK